MCRQYFHVVAGQGEDIFLIYCFIVKPITISELQLTIFFFFIANYFLDKWIGYFVKFQKTVKNVHSSFPEWLLKMSRFIWPTVKTPKIFPFPNKCA